MAKDISRVTLTGRLTRDVELRHTPGGTAVSDLRVAFTTSRKDGDQWVDNSNFVDVTVWGRQAEVCAEYLAKGRRLGVDGRLEFDEWEAQDGSGKRSKLKVVADNIAFLDSRRDGEEGGDDSGGFNYAGGGGSSGETPDFVPEASSDDDIPF